MSENEDKAKIYQIELNQAVMTEKLIQQQKALEVHMTTTDAALKTLGESINKLNQTMNMVQYILLGCFVTYFGVTMGWLDALKLVI